MKHEIAVIGTTFVDCKGFADGKNGKYVAAGRNTGTVQFVHGGVGRNVAENLAKLGQATVFASTVDDSALGREVLERLTHQGVDIRFVTQEKEKGMGLWMVILDEKGEQVGSLSHMPELKRLEKVLDEQGENLLKRVSHVALEIDLTENITEKILNVAEQYQKPVYALPGNLSVILARPDFLPRLAGFICNHIEIGRLFQFDSEQLTPQELLERVFKAGTQRKITSLVVTMGPLGAIYYDVSTQEKGYVPAIPTKVKDVSGAGDAFFSGTIFGLLDGKKLQEAVQIGTRLASLTIQTSENCCQTIEHFFTHK